MFNLYHGTTKENAENLMKNGWSPNSGSIGNQCGQSKYLYLTNIPENALWYAEQKGDSVVLLIEDIPEDFLKVDPEDGVYESVFEELDLKNRKTPGCVVLFKEIPASKIKLFKV